MLATQLCFDLTCPTEFAFDNFVGEKNKQVIHALNLCLNPENHTIWHAHVFSAQQTGKTHLLKACCHQVIARGVTAIYIDMSHFYRISPDIFQGLDQVSLVCIDNIDCVIGKAIWEEALFDLYNRLIVKKVSLVIAAKAAPKQLGVVLPDLKTRLSQGLVMQVETLSDADLLCLMQEKSQEKGFFLPERVAAYALQYLERDIFHIVDFIEKISILIFEKKQQPTIKMAKNLISC